ncbi:MAG: glycosyltransferase family 4 protein [Bacteroidales bacterium]|jgi:glycosyltransferase involved in cell wall biosynthesis|nr:glycosyltransferase family 4 protein [Bacteroidales bacterium]
MNILYICPNNPFLTTSGGHLRSNLICQAIAKNNNVDIFFTETEYFLPPKCDIPNCTIISYKDISDSNLFSMVDKLKLWLKHKIFRDYFSVFKINFLSKTLNTILNNKHYDLIMIRYFMQAIELNLKFDKRVILDLDDSPVQIFKSLKENFSRSLLKYYIKQVYFSLVILFINGYVNARIKNIRHVLLPDKKQAKLFPNGIYLPNIPNPSLSSHSCNVKTNNIMFVGKLQYRPNIEGVYHFLDCIWPKVLKNIPNAFFNIVGSQARECDKKAWQTYDNVNFIGFVDDLSNEYNNNSVAVIPVYMGAGTNIKVIEAMYMNKAMVLSSYACRGFEHLLKDGYNSMIASTDEEFSAKLIFLLKNRELNAEISKNAKESLNNEYSFENFCNIINRVI